ncbi:hypothetical protein sos41_11270 [Alphaproteobacteria bacterium SO-S41]|nr:hypothetical protein sos41_11270 [Alphaproteobacteria bacterium SO-S41]
MNNDPSPYRAFISYRHADKAWGDWLHKALEAYRVPRGLVGTEGHAGVVPDRLGRVFRDREELAAASDLAVEIQEALRRSANLIVICSRGAAQSHWVNEEIVYWKGLGREARVFAIIVDGEPNALDPANECFPPALKFAANPDGTLSDRPAEPIAADAREAGDGKENAKLKLIAGLLGVGFDQLRRREAEAQRRAFRRFAAIAAALVLAFAGLAGAAGWFAWQSEVQRAEAVAQRSRAEANLDTGIGTAKAFITDLTADLKTAAGAQRGFLIRMQQRALALLDALASGQKLPEAGDEAKAQALVELAAGLIDAGDTGTAMQDAEAAHAIMQRLATARPDNAGYTNQLTDSLDLVGTIKVAWADFPGALEAFSASKKIREGISDPSGIGQTGPLTDLLMRIADIELSSGQYAKAGRDFDAAYYAYDGLLRADLNDTEASARRCLAQAKKGLALAGAGDLDGAGQAADAAIADARHLGAAVAPEDAAYYGGLAATVMVVGGDVYAARRDFERAGETYDEALGIIDPLAAEDPTSKARQFALGAALAKYAAVLGANGEMDAAVELAAKAEATLAPLVTLDPLNKTWAKALAEARASRPAP